MSLENKIAFVSGASMPGGIGHATAINFAKQGADVAVSGFSHMEGAQALAEEIKVMGRRSMAVKMDVTKYPDVQNGFELIREQLGPVNILVNNAALMNHNITIAKTTVEEWDYEVKVCLNSAFYCIKEVWADMCANKWGRIINITSVAAVMGGYGQTSYGAAKGGLISLAKSAALEGARFNITANCVAIGIAATEAYQKLPKQVQEKVEKKTAIGRPAKPREIADAISYLASDKGQYMTGAVMDMLGGMDLFVF